MAIYEVVTVEHASRGGEYSCEYLLDSDELILIANPEDTQNRRIVHENSEIAKVNVLVKVPHYQQRNGEGWYIVSSKVKEVPRKESKFDELVRKLSPDNNPDFFTHQKTRKVA